VNRTFYSTITSKGQTTIPREIRKILGLKPRDKIAYKVKGDEVVVEGINLDIEDLIGSIKPLSDRDPGDFGEIIEETWRRLCRARPENAGAVIFLDTNYFIRILIEPETEEQQAMSKVVQACF
jgi:AbrB family looped-hinge helix DNA binding protein